MLDATGSTRLKHEDERRRAREFLVVVKRKSEIVGSAGCYLCQDDIAQRGAFDETGEAFSTPRYTLREVPGPGRGRHSSDVGAERLGPLGQRTLATIPLDRNRLDFRHLGTRMTSDGHLIVYFMCVALTLAGC